MISASELQPSSRAAAIKFSLNEPPPQPLAIGVFEEVVLGNDGTTTSRINLNLTPPPRFEAGITPTGASSGSVTLASTLHNQTAHSLDGNDLRWSTGSAQLAATRKIVSWAGTPTMITSVSPAYGSGELPNSGDHYFFENRHGDLNGFEVFTRTESETDFRYAKSFVGVIGAVDVANQGQDVFVKVVPFSSRGVRNEIGPWVLRIDIAGDLIPPAKVPGYAVQQINQNTVIKHTWAMVPDYDVDYYEMRDGLSWLSASFIGRAASFTEYFDQTVFDAGSHSFLMKAVDQSGNESTLASQYQTFIYPRGNVQGYVINDFVDHVADELTIKQMPRYSDRITTQDSVSTVVVRGRAASDTLFFADSHSSRKYKGLTPVDVFTYIDTLTNVVTHN